MSNLPEDAQERKDTPIWSGFVNYFPRAMAEVARLSKVGNDQHNPGSELHWDRAKSGDEKDACMRHLVDAGTVDVDGELHSTKVAWRAMANLEKELEGREAQEDAEDLETIRVRLNEGGDTIGVAKQCEALCADDVEEWEYDDPDSSWEPWEDPEGWSCEGCDLAEVEIERLRGVIHARGKTIERLGARELYLQNHINRHECRAPMPRMPIRWQPMSLMPTQARFARYLAQFNMVDHYHRWDVLEMQKENK